MILPYVMLNIWSSPMTLVLLQVWVLCSDQFPQIENMSKTCNLDQRQNIEKKLMISIKSDNDATAAHEKIYLQFLQILDPLKSKVLRNNV